MSDREKLVEVMAIAIMRTRAAREGVHPTVDKQQEWFDDAKATLAALEASGVRLVPVRAVMEQMPEVKLPMDVDLFCNTMLTCGDLYNAMVAASPFSAEKE